MCDCTLAMVMSVWTGHRMCAVEVGAVAAIEDACRVDGRAVVLRGRDIGVRRLEEEHVVAALGEADLVASEPLVRSGGRPHELAVFGLDTRADGGGHAELETLAGCG